MPLVMINSHEMAAKQNKRHKLNIIITDKGNKNMKHDGAEKEISE